MELPTKRVKEGVPQAAIRLRSAAAFPVYSFTVSGYAAAFLRNRLPERRRLPSHPGSFWT